MKVKTSELIGPALDWTVAKCEGTPGLHIIQKPGKTCVYGVLKMPSGEMIDWPVQPSTDWSQGGPIVDRELITCAPCCGDLGEPRVYWIATVGHLSWEFGYGPYHEPDDERSARILKSEVTRGPTPLVAAMRCLVTSKLGNEVEIPEELCSPST